MTCFFSSVGVAREPTALPAATAHRHGNTETSSRLRVTKETDGDAPAVIRGDITVTTENAGRSAGRKESRIGHAMDAHVITGINTRADHAQHILATAGEIPVCDGPERILIGYVQGTSKNVEEVN